MKILVLGGYGNFGARICKALAPDPEIRLLVAGRDAGRAASLAAMLGSGAAACAIDIDSPRLASDIGQTRAALVIHAAGPFQGQDYRVAHASAAAGAHYIDLADARRFVCAFSQQLGAPFERAGRVAITGASTVPGLSSAVLEHLTAGWSCIDSVDCCIAPAQTAPRGKATLAAVLSYCGEPITVWEGGHWQHRIGWARPQRVEFARLTPRLGAVCDIPDLELFPAHYRVRERVLFRAALEVGFTQRALGWLAALRQARLIGAPARLAGLLHHTARWLDGLGSSLGGMVLRAAGRDAAGQALRRSWHITAPDDHGPEIPCMAAILLARRLAQAPASLPNGAHPCVGLLRLEEFHGEFARWGMATDTVQER